MAPGLHIAALCTTVPCLPKDIPRRLAVQPPWRANREAFEQSSDCPSGQNFRQTGNLQTVGIAVR